MGGIHEGEEIADRDGLHARIAQLARGLTYRVAIKRDQNRARVIGAFGDIAGQALRRDGRGLGVEIIEEIAIARLGLHLLNGAEAFGDQQAHLCPAHFEQRIGGDGGAMREECNLVRRDPARHESRDPIEHPERRIFRRARHLLDHELAARHIQQHEIRMSAADVDAEPVTLMGHLAFQGREKNEAQARRPSPR